MDTLLADVSTQHYSVFAGDRTLIPQIEYWISFELWGAVKRSPIYGGRDLEEGEDLDLEIGEVGLEDGDLRSLLVEAVAFEEAEQA